MKKLWFPAFLALCGFSCAPPSGGDYAAVPEDADFGARNAAWEKDPCVEFDAENCDAHPMQCQCSGNDEWALVDRQTNSQYFEQEISPQSLGKVSLWGYYWARCDRCEQQFAYMQTMKDVLKAENFDVEFVGVMYTGGDVGDFGQTPRDHMGACGGARANVPSCTANPGQITLDSPVVVNGGSVATMNGVGSNGGSGRGNWFIYRADGKLYEFIDSEALSDGGFLGRAEHWNMLKSKMKAAVMVPTDGVQPCSADFSCTHEGQWCQYPEGQCGGRGICVTSDLPANANRSMGLVEQVCNADGRRAVCTCAGSTYSSRCDAELDEENISHLGACD